MISVFRERILASKNAYITGGTSGICLGIAELFARQGARVAVQGRNPEKVQAAMQLLASHGSPVRGCPADVRDAAATGAALQSVRNNWGDIEFWSAAPRAIFPRPPSACRRTASNPCRYRPARYFEHGAAAWNICAGPVRRCWPSRRHTARSRTSSRPMFVPPKRALTCSARC